MNGTIFLLAVASAPLLLLAYVALVVGYVRRRRAIVSTSIRRSWAAALWAFPLACVGWTWQLVTDPSSTAVIGIYFVPLAATVVSLIVFAAGWALLTLVGGLRSPNANGRAKTGLALVVLAAALVLAGSLLRWQLRQREAGASSTTESLTLARDAASSPQLLERLAAQEDLQVLYAVASHPRSPAATLARLARRTEPSLRSAVAANPAAPLDLLELLATDGDARVRRVVAANERTPPSTLFALARDADTDVRRLVTSHVNTPLSALEILAQDSDEKVRRYAAQRLGTPQAP